MTKTTDPVPQQCDIEIETLAAPGGPDVRLCGRMATWGIRCSVRGGGLGPTAWRCNEHVGGTVEWWLEEPSTTSVSIVRQHATLIEAAEAQGRLARAEGWHVDHEFPNPPDWEGA